MEWFLFHNPASIDNYRPSSLLQNVQKTENKNCPPACNTLQQVEDTCLNALDLSATCNLAKSNFASCWVIRLK